MKIEELIKYLQNNQGKKYILVLEGIINTNIIINMSKIEFNNMYLLINNSENEKEKIILNLHQLIRFNMIEKNTIVLEFDQLQTVYITIK
ncbi:MAG: hypothetical protein E7311_04150 [Clostridiales bacterium]|nr:hypothetical protein [Clostridiales bacterium]